MTGVDEQSRTSDEAVERPMQVRYEQKMAKYGRVAEQNDLIFIPAVFSRIVQIHGEFKGLIKERISQKLIHFEGEAKKSMVRSTMKWWSSCISMIISKTASRDVAAHGFPIFDCLHRQGQTNLGSKFFFFLLPLPINY